jgi:molybdopterin-guanine dinucleotide biosynthesis protein A
MAQCVKRRKPAALPARPKRVKGARRQLAGTRSGRRGAAGAAGGRGKQGSVQALVLAGGLATRMRPHTLTVPKSLLPVAGRPFVEWQLERLVAAGLRDIVMCIGHLGEQIRAHVGDGARFGARIAWSQEGPKLLGTAGAVRAALPLLARTFLVTYGDSYLPFDYAEPVRKLEAEDDCDGVMAIYRNAGRWDASNVLSDGVWVLRYEKGAKAPDFDWRHRSSAGDHRETSGWRAPGTRGLAERPGPAQALARCRGA